MAISSDLSHVIPNAALAAARLDLSADTRTVTMVAALLWTFGSASDWYHFLDRHQVKNQAGKPFTLVEVKAAIAELRGKGLLLESIVQPGPGTYRLVDAWRSALYLAWMNGPDAAHLVEIIAHFEKLDLRKPGYSWRHDRGHVMVALVRAAQLSTAPADIKALHTVMFKHLSSALYHWSELCQEALLSAFDPAILPRIDPVLGEVLICQGVVDYLRYWEEKLKPAVLWAQADMRQQSAMISPERRRWLAHLALLQNDRSLLALALDGLIDGTAEALRAGALVLDGEWAAGQKMFEGAIKQRYKETGTRKYPFEESLAWLYPLALLAQGTPKHLETARKFCIAEAGKREPSAYEPWGRWVNAIDARLGKAALVKSAFSLDTKQYLRYPPLMPLWDILLLAWLGVDPMGVDPVAATKGPSKAPKTLLEEDALSNLRARLTALELHALKQQVDHAVNVLGGGAAPANFFVSGSGEEWVDVLATLQALVADADAGANDTRIKQRIVWQIHLDREGQLRDLMPFEQKCTTRGWGSPKQISLSKLASNQTLAPWDIKVAHCLRAERYYANRFTIDLAAAICALVGHPALVMGSNPGQLIELIEAQPEIEVVRQGDKFVMKISPPIRPEPEMAYYPDTESRRDAEALRHITLLIDSAQRVRLVRYNTAQRQAAQLVSGRFSVPATEKVAQEALQKTLHALSGQFQVNADSAQASRQVAAESRLRAELAPIGEALTLRLVVAPLGEAGPRWTPGRGRVRLMATIGAETLGTQRDLAAEKQHLDSVLNAVAFLDETQNEHDDNEWLIEDPEQALALVEVLPSLPAIAAVDWPKGKKIRVITVDPGQLGIKVSKERDWFRVAGQVGFDDGLVVQLETLLTAAQEKSRFIPMGDGVYAALTRSLKQKLLDLAAVAEIDKQGSKVPQIAAAWLDEILDGTELNATADFRKAIERLRDAQAAMPVLPNALQAQLRTYQEEGYQWAMRLAAAGMGGCLADDMGLGKTLQALALMLERAAGGATLVIAPTSVCGNWLAEATRFAPSLSVRVYSEGDETARESWVKQAGPQDVLIVSYTLLQLAQERFAGRHWHTLVADEAQAIKNATTKRSQAVFDLPADFRLALSGTPVENRLAELWSIMRFVNPGLLGTIGRFNERFATPIERNRDREAQHVLKRLIGPFVLRRTKGQVLQDLPPRTELVLSVEPEAAEAAYYEALRRQALQDVSALGEGLSGAQAGQARFNILAQLTKLRRAACDPRLPNPEFGITGAKVQAFAELAMELTANGHKALVFSQFVDFLQILKAPLDAAGIRYQYLDGATPAAERSKRVAAFQAGEGDLFLISLKAGGFGLNLTAADYVVITDPWWNPAAEDQAMGRAHRIGQQRPVTVYRLVSKGTIEERIVDLHHDKRALADSILDDGDATSLPSTEDLIALIRGD